MLDFQKTKFARFMNTRVPANRRYQPTEYEHAANCATHALWIVPSILGSFILCCLSDDQWEMISAWIYGFGLCGLFIVSTVFHTISWKKRHLRTSKKSGPRFEHKKTMTPTHPPLCHPSPGTESASINLTTRFGIAKLMLRELGPWTSHMRWIIWIMACVGTIYVFLFHERLTLRGCLKCSWVASSTAWGWFSSRAMDAFPLPTPFGTFSYLLELVSITMPSGNICTTQRCWQSGLPNDGVLAVTHTHRRTHTDAHTRTQTAYTHTSARAHTDACTHTDAHKIPLIGVKSQSVIQRHINCAALFKRFN
uniref:Monocyte to macrophage differentiation-associated 2b n=1 Tax=Callorhinchus milii TaxID=7868 RepID=A0A4W3JNK2_CALMI